MSVMVFPSIELSLLQAESLLALLQQGKAVLATKTMPPAKLHGDWQVMETVYSVVNRQAFQAWREAVLHWLNEVCGENSETYWSFFDGCRVPYFMEACEGVAHMEKLHKSTQNKRNTI
jgi:hypothetical protein